jgi:hypothetical protein
MWRPRRFLQTPRLRALIDDGVQRFYTDSRAVVSSGASGYGWTPTRTGNGATLEKHYFSPSHPAQLFPHLYTNNNNAAANSPPSSPSFSSLPPSDYESPDKRTLVLGKTIRTLQERIPTILHTPLPTEILSPSISLHLFPSTHPHLPAVRGRVAYVAALWTAPVAWGRLPGGGGVTLEIVSQRMVGEKLHIRWRATTTNNNNNKNTTASDTDNSVAADTQRHSDSDGGFSGIFIFEFDEAGRVSKHVIENCELDDGERLAGVITFTEWLIMKAKEAGKKVSRRGTCTPPERGLAWMLYFSQNQNQNQNQNLNNIVFKK